MIEVDTIHLATEIDGTTIDQGLGEVFAPQTADDLMELFEAFDSRAEGETLVDALARRAALAGAE